MILDDIENLTHADAQKRVEAYLTVSDQISRRIRLTPVELNDFERLGHQLGSFDQWPDSEKHRFRRIVSNIRQRFIEAGVVGTDGYRVKK